MPISAMASPLFVRSTPKGIRWSVVSVPSGSRRWLELEISKVGTRGLLRQQRVIWDLSAASWDRGRPPLALPKAVAAQLEQALVQLDRQGPSGGWQFRSESRARAVASNRRSEPSMTLGQPLQPRRQLAKPLLHRQHLEQQQDHGDADGQNRLAEHGHLSSA